MADPIRKHFEVLVIGTGPAGLAAAASAADQGAKAGILDDNPDLGGQIWRGESSYPNSDASKWAAKLRASNVEVLCGTHAVHHDLTSRTVFAEGCDALFEIRYEKLILATGARERLLPFPGWTLPNVMAAGGLQAMVKSGLPIAGKRVVVAGSGPLLLAVAAYVRKRGAKVLAICEQASWNALAHFTLALFSQPGKIAQALTLQRQLRGVPFSPNTWPIRALGKERLEATVLCRNGTTIEIACDYLACGFHLIPNTELASLFGCRLRNGFVDVDPLQQTSVPGVYCVGEPTGIGLERSLLEGQIAGIAAAGKTERTRDLRRKWYKPQGFAKNLDKAFALRPELKALPDNDTIICRCEDVTHERAVRHTSWRDAKNQTRCGMGPCQGRICGPATQFLYDWHPDSVRPPIFPVRVQSLATIQSKGEVQ
ncbi:MAG TPA: FAD/NAD(P)-binding oxidoreductase [Bryobacteraceae bacterium]|nr:FAD/NAD(P)-binding oxidoreductase [Bryobacteraceae bacterium]